MQEHFPFTTDLAKPQKQYAAICFLYRLNYQVSRCIFNVEIVIVETGR
ncbi:hypothetical protein GHH_c13360 [Geobacillus sp. GHH01]|nr:hypothetical protein GHH_c13360 [Geobacillus sp. GHH01]